MLAAGLLVLVLLASPTDAAPPPAPLSARSPQVAWSGTVEGVAPFGCDRPSTSCDVTRLTVDAQQGSWITVSLGAEYLHLRVTEGGRHIASAGQTLTANPDERPAPTVTFAQVRSGRVQYEVAIGSLSAAPPAPDDYRAVARLAGRGFDRAGDCGVTSGVEHLQEPVDGPPSTLHVRLVAEPGDRPAVVAATQALVETYDRIGVRVRVSYDFRPLVVSDTELPYEQVRRAYGGVRPRGVDVVHVMTDQFAGGVADCIGGIAYPEKAFSVGNVHYTVQGVVPVDRVPAGMVAAHEIGHLLGAQHQQVSCVEALPQQVVRPASDGWTGPCTLMSPAALAASETWSTLERATVLAMVRRYASR